MLGLVLLILILTEVWVVENFVVGKSKKDGFEDSKENFYGRRWPAPRQTESGSDKGSDTEMPMPCREMLEEVGFGEIGEEIDAKEMPCDRRVGK